jgi:hypothetical protein
VCVYVDLDHFVCSFSSHSASYTHTHTSHNYTHTHTHTHTHTGLSLFSGEGPLVFQEWHNQHEHRTILRLGANSHTHTHPFSAYSRSPELREIRHFFQQSHLPHTPTQLTIRVCVCDTRTGKEACVYESQKETDRHCQDAAVGWPVPANSLAVTDHAGMFIYTHTHTHVYKYFSHTLSHVYVHTHTHRDLDLCQGERGSMCASHAFSL